MKKSEITVEALKSLGYKGFRHNPNKPISSTNITHETDSAIEDIVHAVHNGIKVTFNTSDIHRNIRVTISNKPDIHGFYEYIERTMTDAEILDAEMRLRNNEITVVYRK